MTRAPPKQAAATSWPVLLKMLCCHAVVVAAAADDNRVQEIAVHGIAVAAAIALGTPLKVGTVLLC